MMQINSARLLDVDHCSGTAVNSKARESFRRRLVLLVHAVIRATLELAHPEGKTLSVAFRIESSRSVQDFRIFLFEVVCFLLAEWSREVYTCVSIRLANLKV